MKECLYSRIGAKTEVIALCIRKMLNDKKRISFKIIIVLMLLLLLVLKITAEIETVVINVRMVKHRLRIDQQFT